MNPGQPDNPRGGVRLRLLDPARTVVLMALSGVTARQLAARVGWRSHSYMTRLLRGEVDTVGADAAVRIAEVLEVGVDDLFVSAATSIPGRRGNDGGAR